jgi:hypothetical protein
MDEVTRRAVKAAKTKDEAVAILCDKGIPLGFARSMAAIERGEHPGDLVDLAEWEQDEVGTWSRT